MRNQLLKIVTENGLFGWGEGGRVLTAVLLAMAMCSNRVPRSPGLGVEASEDAIRAQTVEPVESAASQVAG